MAQVLYPQKWSQEANTLFTDYVNTHMNKLKLLDLFSGIGGFSLGFEKTGSFETIAFCEKDKFCQSVLAKHWKHIRIYDEIRNLKGIQAEVITAGFPCQPFSVAGKRKSRDDDRYLWDETLRVIADTKPKWFVGENVEGIVNIQEGKVLQQIQKDLEAESFQVQCLIIPASGIGAWHQRKRVWIIANSNSRLRGRWRTIEQSGENEVRRIYSSKEEQTRNDIRSKTIGCDAVSGKTENVSNSNSHERYNLRGQQSKPTQKTQQRFGISRNGTEENVSNSNSKGLEMRYKENG